MRKIRIPECMAVAGFALAGSAAMGQQQPISEILVLGEHTQSPTFESRTVLDQEQIQVADADSAAGLIRLVPSAHVQTNSRGETLVFLRDAGERQVALYFDGALLNIPWDNRIDLSLLPATAIGSINVAKGVTSVHYGANVVGGAINLISPIEMGNSASSQLGLEAGTAGRLRLSASHTGSWSDYDYILAAGRTEFEGIPLSDEANLPFQTDREIRSNTDLQSNNLMLGISRDIGTDLRLGVRLIHVDSEKGIASEGYKNPAESSPRYWRYPEWKLTMGIANGEWQATADYFLKGAVWIQRFDQSIDSYTDASYMVADTRQEDDNLSLGARLIVGRDFLRGSVIASVNMLDSTHEERETNYVGGALQVPPGPRMEYQQRILSGGVEASYYATERVSLQFGAGVDHMQAPQTGDKPEIDGFTELNLTAALQMDWNENWSSRFALGQKNRLPTMRELFGAALNRFLVNPDLKSEKSLIFEWGNSYSGEMLAFEVIPFAALTRDTIDQRNVTVGGNRLRQRINLKGSQVYGLELTAQVDLTPSLSFIGQLTAMDIHREPNSPGDFTRLSEKPEMIGRMTLNYQSDSGFAAMAELAHTGRAYSLDDDDVFQPLAVSSELNVRLSYELGRVQSALDGSTIYLRVNNVLDQVVEPQLGLPGAGRWVMGGLDFKF